MSSVSSKDTRKAYVRSMRPSATGFLSTLNGRLDLLREVRRGVLRRAADVSLEGLLRPGQDIVSRTRTCHFFEPPVNVRGAFPGAVGGWPARSGNVEPPADHAGGDLPLLVLLEHHRDPPFHVRVSRPSTSAAHILCEDYSGGIALAKVDFGIGFTRHDGRLGCCSSTRPSLTEQAVSQISGKAATGPGIAQDGCRRRLQTKVQYLPRYRYLLFLGIRLRRIR
jgi:hypothetical protein